MKVEMNLEFTLKNNHPNHKSNIVHLTRQLNIKKQSHKKNYIYFLQCDLGHSTLEFC